MDDLHLIDTLYCDLFKNKNNKDSFVETILDTLNYFIEPDYLFNVLSQQARRNIFKLDNLKTVSLKLFAQHEQFNSLFSSVDFDSRKLGKNKQQRGITIGKVIRKLVDIDFQEHQYNVLENAYEYLIGHSVFTGVPTTGEFYTPCEVSNIMSRIVTIGQESKNNLVYMTLQLALAHYF